MAREPSLISCSTLYSDKGSLIQPWRVGGGQPV
jgi:hypothetical protein